MTTINPHAVNAALRKIIGDLDPKLRSAIATPGDAFPDLADTFIVEYEKATPPPVTLWPDDARVTLEVGGKTYRTTFETDKHTDFEAYAGHVADVVRDTIVAALHIRPLLEEVAA